MSSLARYKRTGGFLQLLSLLETFGPQKKEKFLEMIELESPAWANAIRDKMLTIERIFSWPDQVVIEVIRSLPLKNMAVAMQALKEEQRARMIVFFSPSDKRRLEDALTESNPKPDDFAANLVKLVEMARKMIVQGDLRPEKFDEKLLIPSEFESSLEGQSTHSFAEKVANDLQKSQAGPATAAASAAHGQDGAAQSQPSADTVQLQRSVTLLLKENKTLKDEVHKLRDKLEQIRKIA